METLKKSNQNLSQALITKNGGESSAIKKGRSYKSWEEYSPQYMRIKKQQFASDVVTTLSFTEDRNFKPIEIEFLNKAQESIFVLTVMERPWYVKTNS